jgi:hypothetical protein
VKYIEHNNVMAISAAASGAAWQSAGIAANIEMAAASGISAANVAAAESGGNRRLFLAGSWRKCGGWRKQRIWQRSAAAVGWRLGQLWRIWRGGVIVA